MIRALLLSLILAAPASAMRLENAAGVSVVSGGGAGDVTQAGNNAFTGSNSFAGPSLFTGPSTFTGQVQMSTFTASSGTILGNFTVTGEIQASTFNAIGTAYQLNGVTFFDSGFGLIAATATITSATITAAAIDSLTVQDLVVPATFTIAGVGYAYPAVQGTNNQVLINDGTGILEWADQSGTSNTIYNIAFTSGTTADQSTTGTTLVDLVGSTTTITIVVNSRIRIHFHADGENSSTTSGCIVTVQRDGSPVFSVVGQDALCSTPAQGGGMCTFTSLTEPLGAGSFTFYMGFRRTGLAGTCLISETTIPWNFILEEIRE